MRCGHSSDESNVKYYKKGDGFIRRECLTCKRNRKRVGYVSESKARRDLYKMAVDKEAPRRFETALTEAAENPDAPQPDCITPVGKKSKWIDWATDEELREDYEDSAPTHQEARLMCENCPLLNLCTSAALAKRPYHGVRGSGLIFENGKRI